MDKVTYAARVAIGVSEALGWTLEEAINVVGDTAEYEADGLTVSEAISATLDAISAAA